MLNRQIECTANISTYVDGMNMFKVIIRNNRYISKRYVRVHTCTDNNVWQGYEIGATFEKWPFSFSHLRNIAENE